MDASGRSPPLFTVPFSPGRPGIAGPRGRGRDGLRELRVTPHPVAVSTDVDNVAAVQLPVQERGCHHFALEDLPPVLEPLAGGQHRRDVPVPRADKLEEELRSVRGDRETPDPVDDQRRQHAPSRWTCRGLRGCRPFLHGGRHASEWVDDMVRNGWTTWFGMGGRHHRNAQHRRYSSTHPDNPLRHNPRGSRPRFLTDSRLPHRESRG